MYKKIELLEDTKVWFFSDPHYNHKNICRGVSRWDLTRGDGHDKTRDFDTLSQMNDAIVNGINNNVKETDWLVCLGDWSFGGVESIWSFRKRILCKNIIMVCGNHDHHIVNNKELPNWTAESGKLQYAHQAFTSVHNYLELTVSSRRRETRTYNLLHFPMTIWNKGHKDRIHLYGHVHGNYISPGRAMDVGIDATFNRIGEYRPISEYEVLKYMKGREYVKLSHHSKNTN